MEDFDEDEIDAAMIGARLRWLRQQAGIPHQNDLAKLIGEQRQTYQKWESGAGQLSTRGALKIKRFYKVSLDWLFFGNEDALSLSLRNALRDNPLVKDNQ